MDVEQRRVQILELLKHSASPLSGDILSEKLGVSRQIIVQDIAVLKASHYQIISTNRGYLLYSDKPIGSSRVFAVSHDTNQIQEELYAIVDCGATIRNVMVRHEVYGTITADLNISSRRDADAFVKKVRASNAIPLKVLGGDIHYHVVEAANETILDEIEQQLDLLGFLIK